MVMRMYGRPLQNSSITCHLLQSSKVRYSVFTVVFHLLLILLTKFVSLIEFKKSRMRVQFVISYGLTLMIVVAGVSLQEEQVTHSDKISRSSSIMPTDLNLFHVLISLL
jgi:hypothetical protein